MGTKWYFRDEGIERGPFSSSELRNLARQGRINAQSKVRRGSDSKWVSAAKVKGLIEDSPAVQASQLISSESQWTIATSHSNANVSPQDLPSSTVTESTTGQAMPGYIWALVGGTVVFLGGLLCLAIYSTPNPSEPAVAEVGASREVPSEYSPVAKQASRAHPNSNPPKGTALSPPVQRAAASRSDVETALAPTVANPAPMTPTQLTIEEVVAKTEESVALIKGRLSSGSGFLIRPSVIATNRHVIDSELIEQLKVHFPSDSAGEGRGLAVELLYKHPDLDLAFLIVKTPLPHLRLAPQHMFRRGQEVLVIGNPGIGKDVVLQNAISRGVLSTRATIDGKEYYQLGISINSGNSGGPVLDTSGEVIGVVTSKASQKEGLGFCIPLAQLSDAVKRLDKLSPAEIAAARSDHRLRVVVILVSVTGELYKVAMQIYSSAMEAAVDRRISANVGLETVRGDVAAKLSELDEILIGTIKLEVAKITGDPNIPEGTRHRLVDLWTNYLELKSYVDDPRGNLDTYKAKYRELSDSHDRLSESLKLLLGIEGAAH